MHLTFLTVAFTLVAIIEGSQLFGIYEETDQNEYEELNVERRNSVNPVLLVPGLGGSQLEYRKKDKTSSSYETLWLSFWKMIDGDKGYRRDVSVVYNMTSNTFSSQPDLDVHPVDFGGVDGISTVVPHFSIIAGYYDKLVDNLKKAGYTVGQNLFGIPFDFRIMTPQQLAKSGVYSQVKRLIEKAYIMNGNKRIHLVGHSEGCSFLHQFITSFINDVSWTNKYIASMNLVSPVFGGATIALAFAAGPKKWVVPTMSAEHTHEVVKFFAGVYWMLPNENAFISEQTQKQQQQNQENDNNDDSSIIATVEIVSEKKENQQINEDEQKSDYQDIEYNKKKNETTSTIYPISVKNITWMFDSTGRADQAEAVRQMQTITNEPPKAPNMKVSLHYGVGLKTMVRLEYKGKQYQQSNKDDTNTNKEDYDSNSEYNSESNSEYNNKEIDYWWMNEPKEINGDGDGTVPIQSFQVPQKWKNEQKQEVTWEEYHKVEHVNILKDSKLILRIIDIVTQDEETK